MLLERLTRAVAAIVTAFLFSLEIAASAEPPSLRPTHVTTVYKFIDIDGLRIFYREAGPAAAPTILFLHGLPSSSREFDTLIPLLADRYHLVAPDYPGFGHSDTPSPDKFDYTFRNITDVIDEFTQTLGLNKYALYVHDYGGPIGFRLAVAHPERVTAIIVQNAVAHDDGLDQKRWTGPRAFWADRAKYVDQFRQRLTSLESARARHIGNSPHPERYSPDLWDDEFAYLAKPGIAQIQVDLFYDYRTNVAAYPAWQVYFRKYKPPMLVVWGKYDASFALPEAEAYKRDVPNAEVHILEAGHFALDEAVDEIAANMRTFLKKVQD
ncbi:MAG: alpha/beta fold hydrolase [Hyphomicrobiales bacterium]